MISSIKSHPPHNKTVLLRVDFNISLNKKHQIADDFRIQRTLPTIKKLLKDHNKIIILAHLGRPKGVDPKFSLKPVREKLQSYLPNYHVVLYDSTEKIRNHEWKKNDILMLENLRFFPGEQAKDPEFAQELASLAKVYINDAFGNCHRSDTSMVGIVKLLPSYAGLLLVQEIVMLDYVMRHPQHPVLAIMGGAKVSTKIDLLSKLMEIADTLLVGGGLANTFFAAEGYPIGSSFYERDEKTHAQKLLHLSETNKTELVLPTDVIIGSINDPDGDDLVVKPSEIASGEKRAILDIGPETQAEWGNRIAQAKTIIWNGPVGYTEHPSFARGTDFIYYSITQNTHAVSVVGGGETLAAISKKEYLDHITHISTGGGAMLEYIEKGTLPGVEALISSRN